MSKTKLSFGFNNPKFSDQILQIQYSPTADSLTTSSSDSPLLPKEYHISRVLLAGESAFFLQMFSSSEFLESKLPVRLQIREDEHAAWDILLRCIYHEKTPLLPKGESDKEIANGLDLYLKRPILMKPTQTSRKRKLEEEEEEVKTFDFSIFTDARIQTAVSPSTPAHHDMWNRMTLLVQVLSLCDQFRFHGIASGMHACNVCFHGFQNFCGDSNLPIEKHTILTFGPSCLISCSFNTRHTWSRMFAKSKVEIFECPLSPCPGCS